MFSSAVLRDAGLTRNQGILSLRAPNGEPAVVQVSQRVVIKLEAVGSRQEGWLSNVEAGGLEDVSCCKAAHNAFASAHKLNACISLTD